MPILDHCIRSSQTDVVKAILVYPMNALANDQRDRIRKLVAGTRVSFGVYTGETKQFGPRPDGTPDNERLTRGEFEPIRPICCSPITACWNTCCCGATGGQFSRTTQFGSWCSMKSILTRVRWAPTWPAC